MEIREATLDDNRELQELQAKCPQGTTLIVSSINTPDFFAHVKAYSDYKVYVTVENNRIIGSTACAMRDALVNGHLQKVGYTFQAFVDPKARGKHIAGKMYQVSEKYLRQQDAALVYSLIMEANSPSIHAIEREGFRLFRTLLMPGLAIFKELPLDSGFNIRSATLDDLPAIADLINETWQYYQLHEPKSAAGLQNFVTRIPGYNLNNLFLLEENNTILSCLGFWDWSQVTRMTVERLNSRMKLLKLLLDTARFFRPMPSLPRPGELLNQMMLTPIAFKFPQHLIPLVRHINNLAWQSKTRVIQCVCEPRHPLLASFRGFTRVDTNIHLYIKYLGNNIELIHKPVFIDGIDP